MTAVARIALVPRAAPRPREHAAPLARFSEELQGARRPAPAEVAGDAERPAVDAPRTAGPAPRVPVIDLAGALLAHPIAAPAPIAIAFAATASDAEATAAPAGRQRTLSIQIPPLAEVDAGDDDAGDGDSLTPLEQAIADLVDRSSPEPQGTEGTSPASEPPRAVVPALRVAPTIAPREIAERAEAATSASHVHLVIDEGDRRVVVTVAVRGNDVNVALRAGDDATLAALARNAGSLDEAMRLRGLVLGELTTGRDHGRDEGHDHDPPPDPRERREAPPRDTFTLEEFA